ncbi:phenylalanine--tRNA ligase subunit alpha [Temperatibacter marinus]|uniref:Phenylalanine--tRNA ligase alpha subunit n=1 Tax=Temperatibacter marinus TaxID=1456591 RepID=A0AA52EFA1_9PROT|nr:phenylalanine--tRNA ligase subunit alpha [Temperatibacter marinus]WND03721.1 phenylalanine--tRNA ligase subunit alpha [Temperatibacter marinus]
MQDQITALEAEITEAIEAASDLNTLEEVRVSALGKKGRVSGLMKGLGKMDPEERKVMGPALNGLKNAIAAKLDGAKGVLESAALEARLATETLDVSLPSKPDTLGSIHPISQVMDEIAEIFATMGFDVAEGPDLEDDFHNFTALNIPEHHPARQMHDTFYLKPDDQGERKVLRTHTSPVQIRTMENKKPPIRIIAPGRTYRSDSDATHTPMFHQVEGLVIDKDTHLGHLKGTLEAFLKAFFEVDAVTLRLRPSYFPFTEPSMEVDVQCEFKDGSVKIGDGNDWLEILGSGMVNPRVLEACDLDPTLYQGFAFGCGIDRLAMLKYGMNDLRAFFDADLRWLKHYGFRALGLPSLASGINGGLS